MLEDNFNEHAKCLLNMATATSHAQPIPVNLLVTLFMRLIIGVMSRVFVYVIKHRRLFSMRCSIQICVLSKTCLTFFIRLCRFLAHKFKFEHFGRVQKASPRVENRLKERASWSALFSHWKQACTQHSLVLCVSVRVPVSLSCCLMGVACG